MGKMGKKRLMWLVGFMFVLGVTSWETASASDVGMVLPNGVYCDCDQDSYCGGSNSRVEFCGKLDGVLYYGKAICRGNWWMKLCEWKSFCSTGWEYDQKDFYPVEKCEPCPSRVACDCDQPFSICEGYNNQVEIYGKQDNTAWQGRAVCRGNWWIKPCEWESYCSTGWRWSAEDFYPVP